jgi:hypothetical protein
MICCKFPHANPGTQQCAVSEYNDIADDGCDQNCGAVSYYILDLAKEYSLAGARMGRIEEFAGEGATAELQRLFASGHSQEEIDAALGNAIAYSQLETAEYLLSLGADLTADGYIGVYYAAHNNELEGLKFAISKGVDINVENGMLLNVAVETACNTKSNEIIEWLIQHGADIQLLTPGMIERGRDNCLTD